jgi:hypothetical protein
VRLGIPLSVVTSVRRAQALPAKWPIPILDYITQPGRDGGRLIEMIIIRWMRRDHDGSMSHLGQSRRSDLAPSTSGLPPTSNMPLHRTK